MFICKHLSLCQKKKDFADSVNFVFVFQVIKLDVIFLQITDLTI